MERRIEQPESVAQLTTVPSLEKVVALEVNSAADVSTNLVTFSPKHGEPVQPFQDGQRWDLFFDPIGSNSAKSTREPASHPAQLLRQESLPFENIPYDSTGDLWDRDDFL